MFCVLCKAVLAVMYCYLCAFWLVVTRVMVGIFVGNSELSNFVFEQVLSCIYYRLPCLYVCTNTHTHKEKLQRLGNTYRISSSSRSLIQLCVALFLLPSYSHPALLIVNLGTDDPLLLTASVAG